MISSWEHDAQLTLDPNPEWNSGPASGVQLEMPIIADPAQTLAAYENDEVDLALVPSADVPRIKDDPDLSQQVVQGDVLSLSTTASTCGRTACSPSPSHCATPSARRSTSRR